MSTRYAADVPADVRELDGQLSALQVERTETETAISTAEAERARLDGVLEDGADAAYDRAAAVVRTLRRRLVAIDADLADVRTRHRDAQIAVLRAEEAADAEDRDAVESELARAAAILDAYEARLQDRWNRRNELGLRMPSRLDAIPGRRVHQMAALHFGRFGLASGSEGRRL